MLDSKFDPMFDSILDLQNLGDQMLKIGSIRPNIRSNIILDPIPDLISNTISVSISDL